MNCKKPLTLDMLIADSEEIIKSAKFEIRDHEWNIKELRDTIMIAKKFIAECQRAKDQGGKK